MGEPCCISFCSGTVWAGTSIFNFRLITLRAGKLSLNAWRKADRQSTYINNKFIANKLQVERQAVAWVSRRTSGQKGSEHAAAVALRRACKNL